MTDPDRQSDRQSDRPAAVPPRAASARRDPTFQPYDLFWAIGVRAKRSPTGAIFLALGLLMLVVGWVVILGTPARVYEARDRDAMARGSFLGNAALATGGILLISGSVLSASARTKE